MNAYNRTEAFVPANPRASDATARPTITANTPSATAFASMIHSLIEHAFSNRFRGQLPIFLAYLIFEVRDALFQFRHIVTVIPPLFCFGTEF